MHSLINPVNNWHISILFINNIKKEKNVTMNSDVPCNEQWRWSIFCTGIVGKFQAPKKIGSKYLIIFYLNFALLFFLFLWHRCYRKLFETLHHRNSTWKTPIRSVHFKSVVCLCLESWHWIWQGCNIDLTVIKAFQHPCFFLTIEIMPNLDRMYSVDTV